ncbi:MAG: hypothetical protein VW547_00275 [Alphaproteobacteria bacterium]
MAAQLDDNRSQFLLAECVSGAAENRQFVSLDVDLDHVGFFVGEEFVERKASDRLTRAVAGQGYPVRCAAIVGERDGAVYLAERGLLGRDSPVETVQFCVTPQPFEGLRVGLYRDRSRARNARPENRDYADIRADIDKNIVRAEEMHEEPHDVHFTEAGKMLHVGDREPRADVKTDVIDERHGPDMAENMGAHLGAGPSHQGPPLASAVERMLQHPS